MDFFEKTIVVGPNDLDDLNHVNNIRYIEWIQDISKDHWESRASEKIKNEVVWVVRSHHVEYKNEARLGDKLLIKTFIADTRGPISVRAVEMYRQDEDILLVKSRI